MSDIVRFADAAHRFAGRGKVPAKDLLPLIPLGSKLTPKSKIKSFQIGKIPGRYHPDKEEWAGLAGPWPSVGLSDRDMKVVGEWPTVNVGLRAEDWPAVDCDVNDPEIAAWVGRKVKNYLGFSPVRVRGNSPRCLFVFRRFGDEPIRKMQLIFEYKDTGEHKVEVLGMGQQYVINGIHPTGVAYDWAKDAHLADVTVDGLERVTEAQLREFLETLAKEITAKGGTVTRLALPTRGSGVQGQGVAVNELDPLISTTLALEALNTFKNDEETMPSREQIVSVTAAFKAALGRDSSQAWPDFLKWATAEGWADDEYMEAIWDSLTFVRTGPEVLFRIARSHGWHGDAVLDFTDDMSPKDKKKAEQIIDNAQSQLSEIEQELKSLADKLCYLAEQQRWIVRGTGEMLTHEALNKYPGLGTLISDAGAAGKQAAANKLINSGLVTQVAGVTYLPAKDTLTTWHSDGRTGLYFNRWHDTNESLVPSVTDKDVKPWLDHIEYLFPDKKERDVLIDWMAHVVQVRGVKIRWAPLVIGGQGVGKDLMIKPVAQYLSHNYQEISPDRLFSQFNSYLEREMIVVQEMVRHEKIEMYEKLKAMLAGTAGDTLMIERKFETPYTVPNVTNFLFFSNHIDAVRLDPEDRRFFVIRSDAKAQGSAYYHALAEDFYVKADGWRKVVRWLKQRDLIHFETHQCPEATVAKQEMVDSQQVTLNRWLREAFEAKGCWKDRTVITAQYIHAQARDNYALPMKDRERREVHKVSQAVSALRYAGWTRNPKAVRIDGGAPVCLWTREAEKAKVAPTALREVFYNETQAKPRKDTTDEEIKK